MLKNGALLRVIIVYTNKIKTMIFLAQKINIIYIRTSFIFKRKSKITISLTFVSERLDHVFFLFQIERGTELLFIFFWKTRQTLPLPLSIHQRTHTRKKCIIWFLSVRKFTDNLTWSFIAARANRRPVGRRKTLARRIFWRNF